MKKPFLIPSFFFFLSFKRSSRLLVFSGNLLLFPTLFFKTRHCYMYDLIKIYEPRNKFFFFMLPMHLCDDVLEQPYKRYSLQS